MLAVEDEEISLLVELTLAVFASVQNITSSVLLIADHVVDVMDPVRVELDMVRVSVDVVVVLFDTVYEVIDTVIERDCDLSQTLEGDHEISFDLKSTLVVVLLPDGLPKVEVIDLRLKVGRRDIAWVVMVVLRVGHGLRLLGMVVLVDVVFFFI